jgi:predicted nucleic acid-binding protein
VASKVSSGKKIVFTGSGKKVTSIRASENSPRSFLDTNLLVYSDDPRDPVKQAIAIETVANHLRNKTGVVSLQVLQEYFTSATGKLKLTADLAKRRVEFFALMQLVEPGISDILAAIDLHRLHGLSYWDALILHAAKKAGCRQLLTEDLQHGQVIDGVKIVNLFLNNPGPR